MRTLLLLFALTASLGLSSCQCSDKPPMSPVEDEAAVLVAPTAAPSAAAHA